MKNYFGAVKKVFPEEWESEQYILTKTTGYLGLIKAFSEFYSVGIKEGQLSQEFFEGIFRKIKIKFDEEETKFVGEVFPAGAVGQNKLKEVLIRAYTSN